MKIVVDHNDYIQRATYLAKRSHLRRFVVGACVVKRGTILAEGWSHIAMRSLRDTYSVHAECHALARARHLDLSGAEMFTSAISCKSSNLTLAKPCITCAIALVSAGVERAYFTVNNNETDWIDLNEDLDSLDLYRASPGLGRGLEMEINAPN